MSSAPGGAQARALPLPDEVLLRRFGHVRAVGGAAYVVVVAVLLARFGLRAWPLLLGVPILAVVTTAYFSRSARYPRGAVVASLAADAVVLAGAIAFVGGTGSGLVLLYAIVVVSAGTLLGPASATAATAGTVALGLLQLALEQAGYPPALLHRPELAERLTLLGLSLAGLVSVGYLTATYAGRLHDLIAEGREAFEAARLRGSRHRTLLSRAFADVRQPLRRVEEVADELDERWEQLSEAERLGLATRLRMGVRNLDNEIAQVADAQALQGDERRPEPVLLTRVVDESLARLGQRLAPYHVVAEVPALKVVGDRTALRRVVINLLENVVEHTPAGTRVAVTAVPLAGWAVLVISDDGPGVPPEHAAQLFQPPSDAGRAGPTVGLPLVAELCAAMGAEVRYEPAPGGGARFLVRLRLAPSLAPSVDDAEVVPSAAEG